MTQYSRDILKAAHDCSLANENDLKAPQQCGCFYCMKTFPSSEIVEYSDDEPIKTALCPYCGIDAVIGENAGYPLTRDFLEAMYREWFDGQPSFTGKLRKMRLKSWECYWGTPPDPEEEMEQHLTINNRGRVWFSGYGFCRDLQPSNKVRSKQMTISQKKAQTLLDLVEKYFTTANTVEEVTDVGRWELELTNDEGQKFMYYGSLYRDLVCEGVGLSQMLRETLGMYSLMAFGGRRERHPIRRIAVDYQRGAPEHREQLTIDRVEQTVEHILTEEKGCRISRRYEVHRRIEELFEQLDSATLFAVVEGDLPDAVAHHDAAGEYTITVEYEDRPSRHLSGSFDRNELPVDFPLFATVVADFLSLYGSSEILDPQRYGRAKHLRSDYIYCSVSFQNKGRKYHYISDQDNISVGDWVYVPVGEDNHEALAQVEKVEYFPADQVPFPIEKTKQILRKLDATQLNPPNGSGWPTYCPVLDREIEDYECMEICDVADDLINEQLLEDYDPPVFWTEDMGRRCKACKYHRWC